MKDQRASRTTVRKAVIAVVLAALAAPIAASASASAPSAGMVVEVPKDLAPPNKGTGIGTQAALDHPNCTTGEGYGIYGTWATSVTNSGPPCVVPFEEGDDNGGATSRGVTADSIKIVYVAPPGTEQYSGGATAVTNRTTGQPSSTANAVYDWLVPLMKSYETWGRDLDVTVYPSSGKDETAQRADAVAILAMKPFLVINGDTTGLKVLESDIAKGKTLVVGYGATNDDVQAQAPYRWGEGDPNLALLNTAELMDNQLAGKKAEWSDSEELQGTTRRFGFVYQEAIPIDAFKEDLAKRKIPLDFESTYEGGTAGALHAGDQVLAQQQAPTIVSKMKSEGITTVVLAADIQMMVAMMNQATAQDWFPEWVLTGSGYVDYAGFLKQYPIEQVDQLFGLGTLGPYLAPENDPQTATLGMAINAQDWFWGRNQGSTGSGVPTPLALWLMIGLHTAGPNLTPKTFERGLFSWPVTPTGIALARGYGDQTGLPYPSRLLSSFDFAPIWISEKTAQTIVGAQSPSIWFVGDATKPVRYAGGKWPTKAMGFFDESQSYSHLTSRPANLPPTVRVPCEGCPSTGGSTLTPGAPDQEHFVVEVPTGASTG